MIPLEEITHHSCSGYRDRPAHTILYNILSGSESRYLNGKLNRDATAHNCHCEQRRTVCLKDPKATGQVASAVLVHTVCFVRGLPSFSQLPSGDQSSLLRHCWVSLFVLGLAQKKIVFEVTEVANASILRKILLGPGLTGNEADLPTLAEVHNLRACLHKLWNLDLGPVEYAYLKGALVFNPAVQGLSALCFIEGLQRKGLGALQEVLHRLHPEDAARFTHVLLAASTIQTVSHGLVAQLFFKPVIGNTNMFHLLTEMLSVQ
ncbi:nuclear receptor subfamily 0 group B member 2 [Cyclopterus lumpus]|uniref:nuclear receptor subfamily 0 group B member 2 n=1 Tax=Cyclopterus lumpus TaxID=8103 RepID=UPI001485DAFA|nr:nuclear receptor subfamily 0 group B member 2 [Cyclopterus lumpus]XP_034401262.1 nuclear receptor subfamily 0 group B member 2 [Cyclopterus lumpus]XP_034401263.1 nuclear receptor subfamily 0 group B member 2 [Cyclopterus lumpus]XP_034401264.1 nuclear receptor subfamily 0 group B member 2 [Cyclopterus lumpus]